VCRLPECNFGRIIISLHHLLRVHFRVSVIPPPPLHILRLAQLLRLAVCENGYWKQCRLRHLACEKVIRGQRWLVGRLLLPNSRIGTALTLLVTADLISVTFTDRRLFQCVLNDSDDARAAASANKGSGPTRNPTPCLLGLLTLCKQYAADASLQEA
jgi:hypothetical protein